MNQVDREEIMKRWDKWVKYYKSGGGGSWPRDAFEALLDNLEEYYKNELVAEKRKFMLLYGG